MLFRGDYTEKRDFMRLALGCVIQFRLEGESAMRHGTLRDLSASGLGFATTEGVCEGVHLEVIVAPEKAITPPLHARAEVVRVQQQGAGDWEIGVKILEVIS